MKKFYFARRNNGNSRNFLLYLLFLREITYGSP